jgi:hypothetical protein
MRLLKMVALVGMLAFVSVYSVAKVPKRSTSENGQGSSVSSWRLLERSQLIARATKGTKVAVTREVVCANPSDQLDAGQCPLGQYLFIFQLQSTATNVSVRIGTLLPGLADAGVLECDEKGGNTEELCTSDTTTPSLPDLEAAMTAVPNKTNSTVTFSIPDLPAFPPGLEIEEGQGLTIYVLVNQTQPVPVTYPTITIF